MTSVHKDPTPDTSPLLSCCAAHININEMVSPLDDMNVDGVGDQASSRTNNFKPDVGKEALQSPVTTQKKRTQKSEEKQLDKEVVAIYQKACEKSNPAEKSKADSTSKRVQTSNSSSKKPAGNATTKKLALQNPSECGLTSYRRNKNNALHRSASLESPVNSDTDEPTPRAAVLISATNNSVPKSPAKSNRKTASKGVAQRTLSKKNRKEWVIADFGCITVGNTGHRGYSTISLTGFSDKMARKLGNEIAQHAGTRGVRKERAWGYGYEFRLRIPAPR